MQTLPNIILIVSFLFFSSAPDLSGQWNGALNVQGSTLRVVFHVTSAGDVYEATFDSPDQNVTGIPVSKVTYDFPNVRFESTGIGMVFEGKVNGDEITGLWKQSGMSFDLTLLRNKLTDK